MTNYFLSFRLFKLIETDIQNPFKFDILKHLDFKTMSETLGQTARNTGEKFLEYSDSNM